MYNFLDYKYTDGTNYYRLTQTDFNGQSETFNIISIRTKDLIQEKPVAYDVIGRVIKSPDSYIGIIIYRYINGFWFKRIKLE
jgi:hypothetical protein